MPSKAKAAKSKPKKKGKRPKMKGEGLVFKYGASAPTHNKALVLEQFELAQRYRNKLCELERERRCLVHEALSEMCPDLVALLERIGAKSSKADRETGAEAVPATGLEAEIEAAIAAVKARRVVKRNKSADAKGKKILGELKKRRSGLFRAVKALRDVLYASDEWKADDAERSEAHNNAGKLARKESGLYWGTYLQVENAAQSMRKGTPPGFRYWSDRKDKIAVQLQGGLDPSDLTGCEDRRARLSLSTRPMAEPGSKRGERVLAGVLALRVGSDGNKPVWAEIPLKFHRPIPDKASIKWIFLTRRDAAGHADWSVQFVCQADSWQKPDLAVTGSVGVDVGWRRFPDRLRIAVWAGSDGREGELALPKWWIDESRKVRRIRGERDRLFDEIRPEIVAWAGKGDAWVARTRSCTNVAKLVLAKLREGVLVPAAIVAWRSRDRHLHEYAFHLRRQLHGSRRELYRVFAASLTRAYADVRMELLDLREFHVLPDVEDGMTKQDDVIKRYVRDACLHTLFEVVAERARAYTRVDRAGTTATCHACGHWDREWEEADKGDLEHECPECHLVWDRDVNAARNILATSFPSGSGLAWDRPPLAPCDVATYEDNYPNMAGRKAAGKRRSKRDAETREGEAA